MLVFGFAFLPCCSDADEPDGPIDPAVRERMRAAIEESEALRVRAFPADATDLRYIDPAYTTGTESVGVADRFPRRSQIERYTQARPWSWIYAQAREGRPAEAPLWPTVADASSLRPLLKDPDPLMRGIAVEALATLIQPRDVPRIAALLEDKTPSIHTLAYNRLLYDPPSSKEPPPPDPINFLREWRPRVVGDYAHDALRYMTFKKFTTRSEFDAWWKINKNHEHCFWYWQRVLLSGLAEIDFDPRRWDPVPGATEPEDWNQKTSRVWRATQQRHMELFKTVAAQLAELPPEVDAKVRLLTNRGSESDPSEDLFPDMLELRVSPERLLELLELKNLWPDVDWKDGQGHHERLVRRIAYDLQTPLRAKHAPRVRELRDGHTYWVYKVSLTILLSRLLPPATTDLDDPQTRDGVLREVALGRDGRLIVVELTRVGLPANWPFLKEAAIAEQKNANERSDSRYVTWSILQELANPPLTAAKRKALFDLLLDDRFEPTWTRMRKVNHADMELHYAFQAVNVHAGRKAIDDALVNDLRWRFTAEPHKQALDIVRAVRDEKPAK